MPVIISRMTATWVEMITSLPNSLGFRRACNAAAWGIMTFRMADKTPETNVIMAADTEYAVTAPNWKRPTRMRSSPVTSSMEKDMTVRPKQYLRSSLAVARRTSSLLNLTSGTIRRMAAYWAPEQMTWVIAIMAPIATIELPAKAARTTPTAEISL